MSQKISVKVDPGIMAQNVPLYRKQVMAHGANRMTRRIIAIRDVLFNEELYQAIHTILLFMLVRAQNHSWKLLQKIW